MTATLTSAISDLKVNGGFSYCAATDSTPADGYMVALTGQTAQFPVEILDDEDAAAKAIVEYMTMRFEIFAQPDVYVGGWIEDGKLWLEPSIRVMDRDEAIKLGQETDQIAVYDVKAGDVIQTGGNGGFLS